MEDVDTEEVALEAAVQLQDGRVLSGSFDRSLHVWDLTTGQCVQQLTGHTDVVSCVVQLQDGRVLSGSDDRSLRLWDLTAAQCVQQLTGHADWVKCVVQLQDGRVLSGGNDRSLPTQNSDTRVRLLEL